MRRLSLPELRLIRERWSADAVPGLERLATIPTFQELRPALDGELRRSRRYERPLAVLTVVPDGDPISLGNGAGRPDGARSDGVVGNGHHSSGSHGNGSSGHGPNGNGARRNGDADAAVRGGNGSLELHGAYTSRAGPADLGGDDVARGAVQPMYWVQLRYLLLGSLLFGTLRESDVVGYAAESQEFVAMLPECADVAARRAVERLRAAYVSRLGIGLRAGIAVYPADGLTLDDLVAHARLEMASVPGGQLVSHRNGNGNGGAHA